MFLQKIEELSKYLLSNAGHHDSLGKFLNYQTFDYLNSRGIFLMRLNQEGVLRHVGSYGWRTEDVESWSTFSMNLDLPFTNAVRENRIIYVESPELLLNQFSGMKTISNQDLEWTSILTIPIFTFGAYSIACLKQIDLDPEHERFLRAIGLLISISMQHSRLNDPFRRNRRSETPLHAPSSGLSNRQTIILDLIKKGYTNQQIASQIGYSESLIRHETMAIYSILKVSGRKELIDNI